MRKGFTLIELLAVILILGIIALIAVPQITNVIEDASKGASETTGEHYIGAVNTKIAQVKLDKNSTNDINDGTIDVSDITVDMTGEKPEEGKVVVKNGNVESASLLVNGYNIICDSKGKCIGIKDNGNYEYYYKLETNLMLDMNFSETSPVRPSDSLVYMRYPKGNKTIDTIEVCVRMDSNELCLTKNNHEESKKKLLDFYEYDANTWTQDGTTWYKVAGDYRIKCSIEDNFVSCSDANYGYASMQLGDQGRTVSFANNGNTYCGILFNGRSLGCVGF